MATATLARGRQGSNGSGSRQDAYQDVTDRIVAALEQGVVPWHRPWRSMGGPRSYAGRPYRGINVWLLELEALEHGYSDPRWITFNAAKQAGGTVRKGERSTPVYFWRQILVKAAGREPRTIVEALQARGVTDAGELERARAQWEYRGKSSGDPLELCEPVRELVAA